MYRGKLFLKCFLILSVLNNNDNNNNNNLAKLDCGLGQSPTVMVGKQQQNRTKAYKTTIGLDKRPYIDI